MDSLPKLLFQRIGWICHLTDFLDANFSNAENVRVMNEVAPDVFELIQRALTNDLLLRLSRITDEPTQSGNRNVSVWRVIRKDSKLGKDLRKETENIRLHRHKRLAHDDEAWALGLTRDPVKWRSIRRCRDLLGEIYNQCAATPALFLPDNRQSLVVLAHQSKNLERLYRHLRLTPGGEEILETVFGTPTNRATLANRS